MDDLDFELDDEFDEEPIEAYCMHCRQVTAMEEPEPVWTRKGAPATRGVCAICGTTVFRMGGTPAHHQMARPKAIDVVSASVGRPRRHAPAAAIATYISFAPSDAAFAAELAENLNKSGIPTWLGQVGETQDTRWAGGVHPSLDECSRMVVVMSPMAWQSEPVTQAWALFRERRKPVALAQVAASEVPDDLRRSPRFDFTDDYKGALRRLVQWLGGS
jgi:hypothetical protein